MPTHRSFTKRIKGFLEVVAWAHKRELWPDSGPTRGPIATRFKYNGRDLLFFSSNDYLSLARDPRIVDAAIQAIREFGTGRGGAPLVCGYTRLHYQLEEELADFIGREACVLFPSGYQANVGVLSALTRRKDMIFTDEVAHASIHDGLLASRAESMIFRHSNVSHLASLLADSQAKHKIVIVDGVYSMQGDLPPLGKLALLCRRYEAMLLVDDAHAIGTIGKGGRGTASHLGLEGEVDLIIGTMSKSLAATGGFALGDKDVIEYIRYQARANVFSAAAPPANIAAALAALDVLRREPQLLTHLREMSQRFRQGLRHSGMLVMGDDSAIVSVHVGDVVKTGLLAKNLLAGGLHTIPVISPGVPAGQELIRMHVNVAHTREDIDRAIAIFSKAHSETLGRGTRQSMVMGR